MRTILAKILKTVQDIYAKMPEPETKEVKEEPKEEAKKETNEEPKEETPEEVVETKSTRRAAK